MSLAVVLLGIVLAGAAAYWNHRYLRRFDGVLERAEQEFRQLRIEAADPAMCFDGRSAVIVDERREYFDESMRTVVRIHRYARNAHGEYFFFISEGAGKPFFKHVEQRIAKVALGKRYVAPSDASP